MDKAEIIAQIKNKLCGIKGVLDLLAGGKEIDNAFLELAKKDFAEAITLLRTVKAMLQKRSNSLKKKSQR
jgi:hypothetical protein